MTYRWGDHSMRSNLPAYRSSTEEEAWRRDRDPLAHTAGLLAQRQVGEAALAEIRDAVDEEFDQAVTLALGAPHPTREVLRPAVQMPDRPVVAPPDPAARPLSYVEAIREAMHQSMELDKRVILLGEDVGRIGGLFQCSAGLLETFGPKRVRDTPISENAIINTAVGAALTGLRPVVEVQFFDFITHMMDAIVNQAANCASCSAGRSASRWWCVVLRVEASGWRRSTRSRWKAGSPIFPD